MITASVFSEQVRGISGIDTVAKILAFPANGTLECETALIQILAENT